MLMIEVITNTGIIMLEMKLAFLLHLSKRLLFLMDP